MLHACCVYVLDLRFCSLICHLHESMCDFSFLQGYITKKVSSKKSISMTISN